MADVQLSEDGKDSSVVPSDSDLNTDSGCGMTQKQDESDSDSFAVDDIVANPDDLLPPVVKLEKYANSDIVFNRQVVARNLLETLRVVIGNQDEVSRVVRILCSLAEDYEPSVRAELMEQVPHIAAFCNENSHHLGSLIQQYLVPMIIKYLTDMNNQIRKTSQSTLLIMVEQGLIDEATLEEKFCPLILQLTEASHMDDHRTEAVTLMSKLSPLVGKEVTERVFLQRFANLCLDTSFHVRKVCAASFGDFSSIVEKEATEKQLLPKFYCLCEDGVWGVRKACAEVFMPVSCVCSMEVRHKELAPCYMNLLCDQSRWVRMAAFQALGPFISTFAEPHKTGLYYSKDGVLTIADDVPNDEDNIVNQRTSPLIENECTESVRTHDDCSCTVSSTSRTNLVCNNSCDKVVPLCSTDTFSATHMPGTTCHSGNYCTVIEVSSSACANSFETDKPISDATGTNKDQDSKYVNCDHGNTTSLVTDRDAQALNEDDIKTDGNPSQYPEYCNNQIINSEKNISQCSTVKNELWQKSYDLSDDKIKSDGNVLNKVVDNNLTDVDFDNLEAQLTGVRDAICSNIIVLSQNKPLNNAPQGIVTVNGFNISSDTDFNESQISDNVDNYNLVHNYFSEECNEDESVCNVCTSSPEIETNSSDNYLHTRSENATSSKQSSALTLCHVVENSELNLGEVIPEIAHQIIDSELKGCTDNESAFNHFQYWRTPLPDVELDVKTEDEKSSVAYAFAALCDSNFSFQRNSSHLSTNSYQLSDMHIHSRKRASSETFEGFVQTMCVSTVNYTDDKERNLIERTNLLSLSQMERESGGTMELRTSCLNKESSRDSCQPTLEKDGEPPPTSQQLFSAHDQDIVPPELLLRYLSMTDASRAQSVDAEIARHCAYSLPAVALTLGRRFWPCLKDTYNTLASDMQGFIMQWKVRRTLASSMHQLAVILGPDIAAQDLLPIFSGFIRDLDEVRIGILQHLAEFLQVLRTKERKEYLPRLSEFLNTDNDRNWRFRLILAEQLIPTAELYDPDDVRDYLVPLSLALVRDKVCEVRLVAVRVMAVMMRRMSQSPTSDLTKAVLSELAEQFIHAPKWLHRQIYVYLCQEFIIENSLSPDQFAEDAMPHLLYLCWDRVANVRLAIARCLAVVIWPLATFSDPDSPHRELLLQAIHTLQSDMDADVRFFANMVATHECSCLQHGALADLDIPGSPYLSSALPAELVLSFQLKAEVPFCYPPLPI